MDRVVGNPRAPPSPERARTPPARFGLSHAGLRRFAYNRSRRTSDRFQDEGQIFFAPIRILDQSGQTARWFAGHVRKAGSAGGSLSLHPDLSRSSFPMSAHRHISSRSSTIWKPATLRPKSAKARSAQRSLAEEPPIWQAAK